jgi:8-oxo-dGTP pyrophosphatase MutT (NUDIX family)
MTQENQLNRRGDGVVVACQRADGRWLLIRRSALVRAPLRVCFPGGWVDPGESQPDAAIREMREELGAEVVPVQCVWQHCFPERPLTLWGWLAELKSPTLVPDPKEVHEVLWLSAAEAARHPDVLPHTDAFMTALHRALQR